MSDKYVLATDDNGNLAVRTVTAEESPTANSTDVITATTDGKLAVRVVGSGGGGSDQHNLGWYATESALTTAHPTASDGDYAIVGDTDTVWVWDGDTTAWVDSGAGGIGLPDQTGQSGKFLTTDGTDASWSDKPLVNTATGTNALTILGNVATRDRAMNIGGGSTASDYCTVVGHGARAIGAGGTCIGMSSTVNQMRSTALGSQATASGQYSLAVGWDCAAAADGAIQIGGKFGVSHGNSDANTLKVGNANGNFEMMSADGTIPEARLADTTNAQQGDVLTLDSTGNAVWQAGGSGGGLPSQTGNAGKFLTTDGTDASWANAAANWAKGTESFVVGYSSSYCYDKAGTLRNTVVNGYSNYSRDSVAVGHGAGASSTGSTCVGRNAQSAANYSISIGFQVSTNAQYAIQLGYDSTNNDANTFKVSNANGNFEIMDANGNLPADRLASTTGLADGNYRLRLTMTNGVPSLSWVAE